MAARTNVAETENLISTFHSFSPTLTLETEESFRFRSISCKHTPRIIRLPSSQNENTPFLSLSERKTFFSFFLSSIPFQRTFNAIIVATVCSSELWTCICRAPRSSFLRISLLRRKKRFTGLKKFYAPFDKMHLFVRHWCGLWCSLEIRNASSFRNSWNC